jgi:ComF family protein
MRSLRALLDVVFPPRCAACAEVLDESVPLCELCALGLSPVDPRGCAHCGEPLDTGCTCNRCLLQPPPFSWARASYVHEGPLARAIHRFKYEDQPELASPLAQLLLPQAKALLQSPTRLLALPLHRARFRKRGFDQARLLTSALSRALGWPESPLLLERVRETTRQVGLSEADRERNVTGAFRASKTALGGSLTLVDDVFTTGATARAAARALLDAGAEEVTVLTLARAQSLKTR